ncbi:heme-degrading domain-containing protein [Rhizobium sp. RU36D]|uniref:heme-degrading domain-containing protein n=1 Tax=Rhizobium sp. RU36D TaxID=1907415 RepID=UPI0009D82B90|nr:heme-degrading domain-containing protein [Rhizobium sp. RU36D]SMC60497.1 Uncharacterized protein, UPF0303 family [Rhizobium sp. RU36D]
MSSDSNLIEILAEQESRLVFPAFDETVALAVGLKLVDIARRDNAPVIINIRTPDRVLFHAAMPGSSPDNDHWARRKSNVTLRFHKASMRIGEALRLKGREPSPDIGLDPLDYASHGGSFPARVAGTGVVAAITVSGLASREDHDMIVAAIEDYLAAL